MSRIASWRWCPVCKGALETKLPNGDDRERLCCTGCGLVIYDNPAPCACAVVIKEGRVLLTKRAVEPALGLWDLPGGYIEVGETPEETLRRELLEEANLKVRITRLIGFFVDTYGDGGTDTLNISYECQAVWGDEAPGSDVAELGWFLPDFLPPQEQLAFRNTRETLMAWKTLRNVGKASNSEA